MLYVYILQLFFDCMIIIYIFEFLVRLQKKNYNIMLWLLLNAWEILRILLSRNFQMSQISILSIKIAFSRHLSDISVASLICTRGCLPWSSGPKSSCDKLYLTHKGSKVQTKIRHSQQCFGQFCEISQDYQNSCWNEEWGSILLRISVNNIGYYVEDLVLVLWGV